MRAIDKMVEIMEAAEGYAKAALRYALENNLTIEASFKKSEIKIISYLLNKARSLAAEKTVEATEKGLREDGWLPMTKHYAEGMEYYRGLVVKIGSMFGEKAYIADDGSKSDSVLCAKVPELVEEALSRHPAPADKEPLAVLADKHSYFVSQIAEVGHWRIGLTHYMSNGPMNTEELFDAPTYEAAEAKARAWLEAQGEK